MNQKFASIGLVVCVWLAVLAFGGTDALYFSGVEVLVFLVLGLLLWHEPAPDFLVPIPWRGPALLLTYALLQSQAHKHSSVESTEILKLLTYLGAFYLAFYVGQDGKMRYPFVKSLLLLGLFEALYGLLQYLSGWQYIFSYRKKFYVEQATGTYINPNHFAGLLEMVLPLAFALTLYCMDRTSRGHAPGRPGRLPLALSERIVPLILFSFVSLLLFVGILFSRSRMGIFSACAALAAMGIFWASSSFCRPWAVLSLSGFFALVILFSAWIGLRPVAERYEKVERDYLFRLGIWKDTASLIGAHPLWGTGLGTYKYVYPRVQTTLLNASVDHAHNDYLEVTSDWGVIGAALLFGAILVVLRRGILVLRRLPKNRDRFFVLGSCGSTLAILFHSLTDFNLQIPANALVLAVILGLSCAISAKATPLDELTADRSGAVWLDRRRRSE